MKNAILIGGVTLASALSSQAAVIAFTDADPDTATVSTGTLVAGQTLADGEAFTSLSYTVSGLSIDSDGATNDSITVTLAFSVINGTTLNWDVIEIDHDGSVFSTTGEGISFDSIGVTGTLSGGGALQVNSALFTGMKFRRWNGDENVTIVGDNTGSFNYTGASSDSVVLNDNNFSVTQIDGGSWQVDNFSFTVDVVPEPSSTALLGLGGLALILRRRK